MTKEELAKMLDAAEYPFKLWHEHEAAKHGLVVVYGASDDLMEFEGAISEEIGVGHLSSVEIDVEGVLPDWDTFRGDNDQISDFERYFGRRKYAKTITAIWDRDGYSWQYATNIPHVTFDIMDDGEKYCRGIVFSLADLRPPFP